MTKKIASVVLAFGLLGFASTARAGLITGTAGFGITLWGNATDIRDVTELSFGAPGTFTIFGILSDDYSGIISPASPTVADLSLTGVFVPITDFWSYDDGFGTVYSFDLNTLSVTTSDDNMGTLSLSGSGMAHITGFTSTPASFSLTTQNQGVPSEGNEGALYTFSASTTAVPEPATLGLLGMGLLGLGARARRRRKG